MRRLLLALALLTAACGQTGDLVLPDKAAKKPAPATAPAPPPPASTPPAPSPIDTTAPAPGAPPATTTQAPATTTQAPATPAGSTTDEEKKSDSPVAPIPPPTP